MQPSSGSWRRQGGSPLPGFGAERFAFDACRTTPPVTVMGDLAAAIGSETTYSGGIGPSGQSDGMSFGRFNEEFAMSRIRV